MTASAAAGETEAVSANTKHATTSPTSYHANCGPPKSALPILTLTSGIIGNKPNAREALKFYLICEQPDCRSHSLFVRRSIKLTALLHASELSWHQSVSSELA